MTTATGGDGERPGPARRRIHRLDERTVHEIAAGEVIERPASVVKELVENSLDAGAHEVLVRVEQGGLARIEVSDDGLGIVPEDLPVAFERHATSKLESALDLPAVRTLGFRGEALAAIAAVARVTLTSRPEGAYEARTLEVEGGHVGEVRTAARAPGTTLLVRDLFFNTPARRKFLKSPKTEALKIVETLEGLYLAHPAVSFGLSLDGGEIERYPAAATLQEATARVFGVPFLRSSFDFSGAAGPGLWVEGVASHPSMSRGTSRGIVLVVDGRVIVSKALSDGVRYAYHELLPRGRYPVVVLHLRAEPGRVDVNVHPTKREVRFEREAELREAFHALLRSKLHDQPRAAPTGGRLSIGDSSAHAPLGPEVSAGAAVPPPEPFASAVSRGANASPLGNARGVLSALPTLSSHIRPLDGTGGPTVIPGTSVHPGLVLLGQVGELYIVGESQGSPRSLVLIDAHAASERVLYERLKATEPLARQELLAPLEVELTARQRATLETYGGELARAGFVVEPFGRSTHRIRAVPFFRGHRARPEALGRLLDELADGGRGGEADPLRERVAKSAACHMAIRGGDVLSIPEMHRLLGELYACPESFTCPHGRPIMLTLPRERLDRWFLRP
ncbi:MAG: DNA mismatch repair endonuclease MutL [Euryarchaeota archaeon]|nr:DNA mismatch repair endonuclease MutL [Euryarchaeota archaeon]